MAKIPEPIHTTINAINQAHEAKNATSKPRPHMGVSQLARPTRRRSGLLSGGLFNRFFGRILRLFRRGHREEETVS